MSSSLRSILLVLFLVVWGIGCRSGPRSVEVAETSESALAVDSAGVFLTGLNGPITVMGTTDQQASLQVEKKAFGSSEDSARVIFSEITVDVSGRTRRGALHVDIQSAYPEATEVGIVLRLPAHVPLQVEAQHAPVTIQGMTGELEVEIEAGAVEVQGAVGDVEVETKQGSIGVSLGAVSERVQVSLRTEQGDVNLLVPSDISSRLDLDAQSGEVMVEGLELRQDLRRATVTGGTLMSGVVGLGRSSIRLRSQHGNVTVRAE